MTRTERICGGEEEALPIALANPRAIDADLAFVIIALARDLWEQVLPPSTESGRWQELMIAAQRGEQRAYAQLLKEASVFVRFIARRYHGDQGAVEDVVQETLISLHRMRHTYEPGRPVEPWIAAIAKARAIDALRSRKRRAAVEGELTDAVAKTAASDARAEEALAARGDIAAALATLPEGQRAALRMLKIEEMSLAEASAASGQSVSALKSLLHRAMQTLRGVKDNSDA